MALTFPPGLQVGESVHVVPTDIPKGTRSYWETWGTVVSITPQVIGVKIARNLVGDYYRDTFVDYKRTRNIDITYDPALPGMWVVEEEIPDVSSPVHSD